MVLANTAALAAPNTQSGSTVHYVTLGDTLTSIAGHYGVTTNSILRYNGLSNPNKIYVGQALIIPRQGYSSGWSDGYSQYSGGCSSYYRVQHGDTLYSIARYYGTNIQTLMQINGLHNPDIVYVGQNLCIPGSGHSSGWNSGWNAPTPSSYYHTVTRGETLYGICDYYDIEPQVLFEANHLNSNSYIQPGQQIYIPYYQPPAPAPAPVNNTTVVIVEQPTQNNSCSCQGTPSCGCAPPPQEDDSCACQGDSKCGCAPQPEPVSVYLRLGRNVTYEDWGRPDYGINDCAVDWYNDGDPVLRFTAEVLLTNKSDLIIPSQWADRSHVLFHTLSGAKRSACKHAYDFGHHGQSMDVTFDALKRLDTSTFPGEVAPNETSNVTFYTHVERGDLVTKMEFVELGLCFDPNSGDEIPCDFN